MRGASWATQKIKKKKKSQMSFEETGNSAVIDKYKDAGKVTDAAISYVKQQLLDNHVVSIYELCNLADTFVREQSSVLYKKLDKGIAMPCVITVNNVLGYFSPLKEDDYIIQPSDLIKVEIGTQVDGYAALASDSFIYKGQENQSNEDGNEVENVSAKTNLINAVHKAANVAIRLLKVGKSNNFITSCLEQVATAYGVYPVMGVLSHQLRQNIIDGENVIINRMDSENKVDEVIFDKYQVYHMDIVYSTHDTKPKESTKRISVYKRGNTDVYNLKMKASRQIFSEVQEDYGLFPFTLNYLNDTKSAKFGIVECVKAGLLEPLRVLRQDDTAHIAKCSFTVVITNNGAIKVCGLTDDAGVQANNSAGEPELPKEIMDILQTSIIKKKKKRKKKTKIYFFLIFFFFFFFFLKFQTNYFENESILE